MDNNFSWESEGNQDSSAAKEELKQLRKTLRKHNTTLVFVSLTLVIAILLSGIYVFIPLVESFFLHPGLKSYSSNADDLTLTLHAYIELLFPGQEIVYVNARPTNGLAAYQLSICIRDVNRNEYSYLEGTLEKNEILLEQSLSHAYPDWSEFGCSNGQTELMRYSHMEEVRDTLECLPEYVNLEAIIAFPEDISMEQLSKFYYDHHTNSTDDPLKITWVAIRSAPSEERPLFLCGMNPFSSQAQYDGLDETYPNFTTSVYKRNSQNLSEHFQSFLRFSSDQFELGRGIPIFWDLNYYQGVLDYVEEYGVYSYGCVVNASANTLLHLLDEGFISYITIKDAWIDID